MTKIKHILAKIVKCQKKQLLKKNIHQILKKNMCAKQKIFTDERDLKKEIIKSNNLGNLLNSSDDNVSSADIVDQASYVR